MDVKPARISLKGCNELQTERAEPAELGALPVPPRGGDVGGAAEGFGVPVGFVSSGVRQGVAGKGNFTRDEREQGGMSEPPRCGSSLAFPAGREQRNDSHGGWLKTSRNPPKVLLLLGFSGGEKSLPQPLEQLWHHRNQGTRRGKFLSSFFMAFFLIPALSLGG